MIVIYEQGDIVYNNNNNCFAIVIDELHGGNVRVLDIIDGVVLNCVPKAALKYMGTIDLKNGLIDLVGSVVEK